MTITEAIKARHSVRQYTTKHLEAEKINKLQAIIKQANTDGKLHIQLVQNEPTAFASGLAKYGKFLNVNNYLAMIGPRHSEEAIGYYGERIVLEAQTMSLNTCWVGLTFKKKPESYQIDHGEQLVALIAIGYGANNGVQHSQKKSFCQVAKIFNNESKCPDWFQAGVEAALLAPTAVNQQKFEFILHDNNCVEAKTLFSFIGYTQVDLGIVKCHFEIAAGKNNFIWKQKLV